MRAISWEPLPETSAAPTRGPRPRHLSVVPPSTRVRRAGVRLTRRGRAALGATAVATAATIGIVLAAPAPALTVDHAVTVRPGQTLSQVAAEELPGMPLGQAVVELVELNDLPGVQVAAGQILQVPAA